MEKTKNRGFVINKLIVVDYDEVQREKQRSSYYSFGLGIVAGVSISLVTAFGFNAGISHIRKNEQAKIKVESSMENVDLIKDGINKKEIVSTFKLEEPKEKISAEKKSKTINQKMDVKLSSGLEIHSNKDLFKLNTQSIKNFDYTELLEFGNLNEFKDIDHPIPNKAIPIRCTGYIDEGYTRSGEWTRKGVVAGRYEWLGKKCNLYSQNKDGSIGEYIGTYEFLDTGYGIKGSLENGTSIDVWHDSEESLYGWVNKYGDYVYIEFINEL